MSPVDFPEHNIERAEDRRDVGQHVATAQEIHRLEVRERRRANFAFVRPVGAVGHQIDPELTLGRLDGGIHFASRNPVAFSVELEMVNGRLHRALHLGAQRRHDLVVLDGNRSSTFGSRSFSRHCFMMRTDWRISSMRIQ